MAYTNSSLVCYTKLSPFHSGQRTHAISKITIHHMAGNLSVETCGNVFQSSESSSNYGVGTDGRRAMYVEEKNRSWASCSAWNDNRAVTIEVANCKSGGDWPVSDKALASLIELCVDICKRNGMKKLEYTGDENGSLTIHSMFAPTACPGPYLKSKLTYIANEVTKQLNGGSSSTNSNTSPKKSVETIAKEVIAGKWGNGDDREKKLEAAGYDYDAVQNKVNEMLSAPKPSKKSVDQIANEVIAGKWGNGDEREKRLEAAGYNYDEVQDRVNEKIGVVSKPTKKYYTIESGDTLSEIADKFDTSVDWLVKTNGIKNPNLIYAGTTIRVK